MTITGHPVGYRTPFVQLFFYHFFDIYFLLMKNPIFLVLYFFLVLSKSIFSENNFGQEKNCERLFPVLKFLVIVTKRSVATFTLNCTTGPYDAYPQFLFSVVQFCIMCFLPVVYQVPCDIIVW